MKKSNKFSPEVRERAVRMVQEHRGEYPSLWAAIESIAPKIGSLQIEAREAMPVRANTLDLALSAMPAKAHDFAIGIDGPFYLSLHSRSAKLGPQGSAVVHVAKYLPVGEGPARNAIEELEGVADLVMRLVDGVELSAAAAAPAMRRRPGDVWQGQSGRWFTKTRDNHVVPAKDPHSHGGPPAPAQAPRRQGREEGRRG